MTYTEAPVLSITERAAAALHDIRMQDQVPAHHYLRVGVKGGGCSGLTYILDFDERREFDDLIQISGIEVLLDKRHALYLAGMEVDYQQGLNDRGFVFNNPNAKTSCGCGTSFSV
ncbi:MAG: iron-sulfur cluster assembly accessory protein [Bacteroidia bacterium]|nr:iron-sulfur cluster assembly accessory protein [Bacteroidia bacterium]